MKNKNLFTVAALASVMMFSCTKENLTNEMGGVNTSKTENYKTPEELAKDVMQKSYADFSKLSREEYGVMITAAKEMQSLSSNAKSNSISSTTETHLEELFYVQEGMFNNQFGDILTESEALERVEKTYNVAVHKDANGEYFMYNTDVATFYNDLAAAVGVELDPSNNEMMVICDLSLESIDDENGSAIIRAGISIAWPIPVPRTPGPMMAAEKLGACPGTIGSTVDAAYYLQGHLNAKVRASILHCAQAHPGTTPYPITWSYWHSANVSQASSQTDYFTNTYPKFWKNDDNACLGNTTAEWVSLYNSSDALNSIGVNYAYNDVGGSYGVLELLYTDYKSKTDGDVVFGFPGNHSLYHGGLFHYGVVYCL